MSVQLGWASGQRAASATAGGQVDGTGDLADEPESLPGPAVLGDGRRRQQRPGVGVRRVVEHLGGRALFDDASEVHDGDAVGDATDHLEVVADEEVAELLLLLDALQQVEDLSAHGDVERRGRLVEQQDASGSTARARAMPMR